MSSEVGVRDGGPRFTAGGDRASTILVVKSGDGGALKQKSFTASDICRCTGARGDAVPRRNLQRRGVQKAEPSAAGRPAAPRGGGADQTGQAYREPSVAKAAALARE